MVLGCHVRTSDICTAATYTQQIATHIEHLSGTEQREWKMIRGNNRLYKATEPKSDILASKLIIHRQDRDEVSGGRGRQSRIVLHTFVVVLRIRQMMQFNVLVQNAN